VWVLSSSPSTSKKQKREVAQNQVEETNRDQMTLGPMVSL
jgi:hypothetical protein